MAKRTSINERAKRHENRISRYLWGHLRDWKQRHDVSGPGIGGLWYGEVTTHEAQSLTAWMSLAQRKQRQILEATTAASNLFVVLHQNHAPLESDTIFVCERCSAWHGPMTLAEFKREYIGEG
jgi:hypothetical protein